MLPSTLQMMFAKDIVRCLPRQRALRKVAPPQAIGAAPIPGPSSAHRAVYGMSAFAALDPSLPISPDITEEEIEHHGISDWSAESRDRKPGRQTWSCHGSGRHVLRPVLPHSFEDRSVDPRFCFLRPPTFTVRRRSAC
jgi:hypothetical protein